MQLQNDLLKAEIIRYHEILLRRSRKGEVAFCSRGKKKVKEAGKLNSQTRK